MPAAPASPIPAVLAKLGPLNPEDIADVRPYLEAVPDPRSPRGRWYPLACILLICACAAISGAKSIDEIAEWGQRASNEVLQATGARPHLLWWRRSPCEPTIDRVLQRLNGDALDAAIGAYLADRHRAATNPDPSTGTDTGTAEPAPPQSAIALDGKALKGSARSGRQRRHLLSAVTHNLTVTLAQAEVGSKTNETRHFRPLLAPLNLTGVMVTFDALHTVKDHLDWLVTTKAAHYVAVIKTNQPTVHRQISHLPWASVPVAHTTSETGHGRRESRSIKTMGIAANLGGIAFPHAKLALRVHRRRQTAGKPQTRETVYAITSADTHQATPAELAAYVRGHWAIENSSHYIRDVTFGEDASTVHTGTAPRAMASFRNLAVSALKVARADNIAKATRAIRDQPARALPFLGINIEPDILGT